MGASYWSNLIAYREDIDVAFAELKREVFESREYYAEDKTRSFDSIDVLVEFQGSEGTHSILDMRVVSRDVAPPKPTPEEAGAQLMALLMGGPAPAKSASGTVFALSDAELKTLSRETVLTREPDISLLKIERGTGRHATIYQDGQPKWLWFGGLSGD